MSLPKKTILVVDDEPHLVDQICESLEEAGFATVAAGSGEKALEIFARQSIDIIVSDVRMVKGDGIWLMSQIREKGKPLRSFIVMSAFSDYTRAELIVKGADEVFQKPFKADMLVGYIRGLFETA